MFNREKGISILLKLLAVAGFFLFLLFFGTLLNASWMIPIISGQLTPFGVNKYFAFALSIPIFLALNFAFGSMMSFSKHKRKAGVLAFFGTLMILALALGFTTKDDRFDENGTPLKSYSQDANGNVRILPANQKVDPITGKKTAPLTPEALERMEQRKRDSWQTGGLESLRDVSE